VIQDGRANVSVKRDQRSPWREARLTMHGRRANASPSVNPTPGGAPRVDLARDFPRLRRGVVVARRLLDKCGMSLSSSMSASKLALIASTCLAVVGCAMPAPIVRLEPRTPGNVVWVAGRAVQAKERAGVRVAAAFERQQGNGLGIRVEIENQTGAPIDVGPDGVTFMTCARVDNASCVGSWGVVDPEQVLAGLDEQQSRSRPRRRTIKACTRRSSS